MNKAGNLLRGMAGIEPTPSESKDWIQPSPCQLGQGGGARGGLEGDTNAMGRWKTRSAEAREPARSLAWTERGGERASLRRAEIAVGDETAAAGCCFCETVLNIN